MEELALAALGLEDGITENIIAHPLYGLYMTTLAKDARIPLRSALIQKLGRYGLNKGMVQQFPTTNICYQIMYKTQVQQLE